MAKYLLADSVLFKRIVSSALLFGVVMISLKVMWIFGLVVSILICVGLYEFFTLVEKKNIHIYKLTGILMGTVIPLSIFFRFELTKSWELLFFGMAIIFLMLLQISREDISQAIVGISVTLFGILYVSWFFSFIIKIRYLSQGVNLVGFLILVTKIGDMGAYLIGSRWGKTHLFSHISPKKTAEGVVGGLVFSVIAALLSKAFMPFSYLHLLFLGVLLNILGQFGDLSESLIKRDCNVKDTGKVFGGLGGVLDVIDSLLFSAPVFYFYMSIILRR